MKPKAIINLLWPMQQEALRQFLLMHEPLVVVMPTATITPELTAMVAEVGSTVIPFESLLGTEEARKQQTVVATQQLGALCQFMERVDWGRWFPAEEKLESLPGIIGEQLGADLPSIVWLLGLLREAKERFDIALVVVNEDVTQQGKTVIAWANAQAIPSLHLAHGIALTGPYTVHNELLADKLAVYGERGKEGFLDLGIPNERLVITGNPAWDCYAQLRTQKDRSRQILQQKYHLEPSSPIVVFATTWAANLTAHCNEHVYIDTLFAFMSACKALREQGIVVNAVIKDRPSNSAFGEKSCAELLAHLGEDGRHYCYSLEDGPLFAAGADIVVAVDSNYLVEAMLAETPVVNLMNASGLLVGPCFEAEIGIQEVEASELAEAIRQLLNDDVVRQAQLQQVKQRIGNYQYGGTDGLAAMRVAQLMANMAHDLPLRPQRFIWQECLNIEDNHLIEEYHTTGRTNLINMFNNRPRLALDIGCAGGGNGALVKQRFPECVVWGIEANCAAAQMAAKRLDKVLVGRFESFDLEAEGLVPGTLDSVILADVLEHMYNPWDVMVKLRSFLSPQGQVLLSIPNVRNLVVMNDLAKGNWSYAKEGILDITHIRFFTLRELLRFCQETGYQVKEKHYTFDVRLHAFFEKAKASLPSNIEMERMVIKNVSVEELQELCTVQFYLLLEKAI